MDTVLYNCSLTDKTFKKFSAKFNRYRKIIKASVIQPKASDLETILYNLQIVNAYAKHADFPIAKTAFYNIKSEIIEYLLLRQYPNIDIRILPKIEAIQLKDKVIYFVSIEITHNNKKYRFHQKLEPYLEAIIADELHNLPVFEYERKSEINTDHITADDIIDYWADMLEAIATNNWFIFLAKDYEAYTRKINYFYPTIKLGINAMNVRQLPVYANPDVSYSSLSNKTYNKSLQSFIKTISNITKEHQLNLCLKS